MDLDIIYSAIFYLLGLIVLAATLLAVTRRNMVHTVVYLAVSFLGLAVSVFSFWERLCWRLWRFIVYAGAIMVLFLFIVLSLRPLPSQESGRPAARPSPGPPACWPRFSFLCFIFLAGANPDHAAPLKAAMGSSGELGRKLFQEYWLPVENRPPFCCSSGW